MNKFHNNSTVESGAPQMLTWKEAFMAFAIFHDRIEGQRHNHHHKGNHGSED